MRSATSSPRTLAPGRDVDGHLLVLRLRERAAVRPQSPQPSARGRWRTKAFSTSPSGSSSRERVSRSFVRSVRRPISAASRSTNTAACSGILVEGVLQGIGEKREPGQRGLEFVGDVGGEVAPDAVDGKAGGLVADDEEGLARPAVSAFSLMQRDHLDGQRIAGPAIRRSLRWGRRPRATSLRAHARGRPERPRPRACPQRPRERPAGCVPRPGWREPDGHRHLDYDAFTHGGQHLGRSLLLGGQAGPPGSPVARPCR